MGRDNTWEKDYTVLTSMCDFSGKLGIRNTFDIFMDMAAEHAAHLGVSYYDMRERDCYWVAVRSRVMLYAARPRLGERITAVTWPGKPSLAKSDRFYRLRRGEVILVEGRTEWAVQDIHTGAIRRTDSYGYPTDLKHREDRVCEAPFTRFRSLAPSPAQSFMKYRVRSTDIDVSRHMNNVAYIRMLLDTFSTSEQEETDPVEVEISYRQSCYEGEELSIYRCREENGWIFQVEKENAEIAVHARILLPVNSRAADPG